MEFEFVFILRKGLEGKGERVEYFGIIKEKGILSFWGNFERKEMYYREEGEGERFGERVKKRLRGELRRV